MLTIFPSSCNFPSLQEFWFFPGFPVLFLSLFLFFHFSFWAFHIFLGQIPLLHANFSLNVSSSLPDSTDYTGWSQQYCSVDGFDYSFDFQLFKFPFKAFGDRSKYTNYSWYHRHPHDSPAFPGLWHGPSICLSFRFFLFSLSDYYYYYYYPLDFLTLSVFHLCLSNSKFLLVSRTLVNILTDFVSAVVWMVSILPLTVISSSFLLTLYVFARLYQFPKVYSWRSSPLKSPIFCVWM